MTMRRRDKKHWVKEVSYRQKCAGCAVSPGPATRRAEADPL